MRNGQSGQLEGQLEPGNFHDRNAVAVVAAERWNHHWVFTTEGIARPCSFLKTGGIVRCTVCDWKTVGKTAKVTNYSCNLP